MSAPKDRRFKLVLRRGRRVGQSVSLDRGEVRIGAAKDCQLRVRSDCVSALHAVVVRDEDRWVIRNRSVNGTFVNERSVDAKELALGDVIQIGAETLIAVESAERSRRGRKRAKPDRAPATRTGLLARPALAGGLVVYLGLMIAGFAILGSRESEEAGPALDLATAERVLESTAAWLERPRPRQRVARAPTEAAVFYQLMALEPSAEGLDPEGRALVDRIAGDVRARFFAAWQLESQQRFSEARKQYGEVMRIVPDPRSPAFRFAVHRIHTLEEFK